MGDNERLCAIKPHYQLEYFHIFFLQTRLDHVKSVGQT